MISVKIVLCLESHETIVELSVHSSTYTHYVNNIINICVCVCVYIYIFDGYYVKF